MVKKADGSWRPCGDFRALNAITVPDKYPLPYIQDCANAVRNKKVFSKIDLHKAFHQIPIEPADIHKTAIITPFGLFEFVYMTFGLCNAAQTFQRYVDHATRDLPFVFGYIDDFLIASEDELQHRKHLRIFFQRLRDFGLRINIAKCEYFKDEIEFLGHVITPNGLKPLPHRIEMVKQFPRPTVAKQLKSFLAMINFYRKFIPHAVKHQSILQSLIKGNVKNDQSKIEWTSETEEAFAKCKDDLAEATLLAYPVPNAPLSLNVDASDYAVGAVLHQTVNGQIQPLGYYSKKLTPTEQRYAVYDRELLAVYQGVRHFRYMLEGRNATIYTDHKPLVYAFVQKSDKATPRRIRHLDYISQFSTDVRHIKGRDNHTADLLSRIETITQEWSYDDISVDQTSDAEIQMLLNCNTTSLQLKQIRLPNVSKPIICDSRGDSIRPFVTKKYRSAVMSHFHSIAHPGIRATTKLLADRFVWPGLRKDCATFVKHCMACQRTKVHVHTKSPFSTTIPPTQRFEHINIDIVGPLPPSQGHRYLLTIIDRFSRWPEAIPMEDMTAERVASALISGWIARFGTPQRITSDQGRQFESQIFAELNRLFGTKHLRTTPRHPQANGIIERFHRTMKAAITCRQNEDWVSQLPIVLLGLRTAHKEDIGATPAEMLYGTTLRLPGEIFVESTPTPQSEFVKILKQNMSALQPTTTAHHITSQDVFEHPSLRQTKYVFVRNDAVRPPLSPAYDGPYLVKKQYDKYFVLEANGRKTKVSVDRLKPAHVLKDDHQIPSPARQNQTPSPARQNQTPSPERQNQSPELPPSPQKSPKVTRFGRPIVTPKRFRR